MDFAESPLMCKLSQIRALLGGGYILLARLGDWYEAFGEDALAAAPLLGALLTRRGGMLICSVPHHTIDTALAKLVRAGRSVALVERNNYGRFISRIVEGAAQ